MNVRELLKKNFVTIQPPGKTWVVDPSPKGPTEHSDIEVIGPAKTKEK